MLSLHLTWGRGGLYLYNSPVNDCISVIKHFSPCASRDHLLDGWSGERLQCVRVRVCAQGLCSAAWCFTTVYLGIMTHAIGQRVGSHSPSAVTMLKTRRPVIKCGRWPFSPAAGPICPNPSGQYPFVLMDANATNWLGTINLQMTSFVLTLSPISPSFLNTLCVQPQKKIKIKIVQSAMWPNWSLQTAGWQRWFEHLCTFENMRWILEGWYWRREKFYYENKEKEKKRHASLLANSEAGGFFFQTTQKWKDSQLEKQKTYCTKWMKSRQWWDACGGVDYKV